MTTEPAIYEITYNPSIEQRIAAPKKITQSFKHKLITKNILPSAKIDSKSCAK